MTDIYLTISLSTHNGDDTPQNYDSLTIYHMMLYNLSYTEWISRRQPWADCKHNHKKYIYF